MQEDGTESSDGPSSSQAPLIAIKKGLELTISPEQLGRLVDPKSTVDLAKLGGVEGLASILKVDLKAGIVSEEQEAELRDGFGPNLLPHPVPPSFLWFVWTAAKDKILIFLAAASIVSLAIGIYNDIKEGTRTHWIEGAAIMFAVVLVVLVNAVNDYQKDRQFRKLSAKNEDRLIRVVRKGVKAQVSIFSLVVGDIILLDPGVHEHIVSRSSHNTLIRMCCQWMVSSLRATECAAMNREPRVSPTRSRRARERIRSSSPGLKSSMAPGRCWPLRWGPIPFTAA